jgi:hypothetical protein
VESCCFSNNFPTETAKFGDIWRCSRASRKCRPSLSPDVPKVGGYKPTAPYQTKYQWGYLHSALEVGGDGRAEALFLPTVSLECSRIFLAQIAASDPHADHIVIWDQAGFHQATGQTCVPRVRILSLPPYCPELNPVEKLANLLTSCVDAACYFCERPA